MDILAIKTLITKNILSLLVKRLIKKRTGYSIDVEFGDISVKVENERTKIHVSCDLSMDTIELKNLIETAIKNI